ncbi:hypothetical protein [Levilactobacillus brevis]|uniref:hypothetical protein n=1 Tax=Levilactobacillus brevis TaxID=1580 RepID=UPI0021A7F44D|nr:hypothetical protein [Levilactobacillus brevis]MCT3570769.1 hypothetical protein [Levilactobacillus brevis]
MTETIKDIAKRLEVTPQRVYQVIAMFKDDKKPRYGSNGRLIVDDRLVEQIDNYFSNDFKNIGKNKETEYVESLKSRIQALEQMLEETQKSLAIANAKDDESKKLLDQQQLQLESMKRVKELEDRLKELPAPKESWWKRIFG